MNSGLLPPVPDLIPIAALRKSPPCNNNLSGDGARECAPCAVRSEVMGEQRSRRRAGNQPAVELIDSAGSRGSSAAPQAPQSRKARSERHRKSDRRRGHRKPARTRSDSKHSKSRETSTPSSSPERPANPRVNPIFVWIRQEDTRIVDVKCEDYDKRNRILLTKTAQGWRAIPRTETLVPSLKEAANRDHQQPPPQQQHHHHHHRNRKSRKSKVRRRSTGVQVDSDIGQDETEHEPEHEQEDEHDAEVQTHSSPSWMSADNVNVESLLPSHTIKRATSPEHPSQRETTNVNSAVTETAQTPSIKCSADKICDVSPLDNLLAVAELEFNQQIQSGEWSKTSQVDAESNEEVNVEYDKNFDDVDEDVDHKEFIKNLEQLNNLIESEENKLEMSADFEPTERKSEEIDYTEDDDNNLAMDDILSRLEQSLRSPDCAEVNNCDTSFETIEAKTEEEEEEEEDSKNIDSYSSDNENNYKSVPEFEGYFEETDVKIQEPKPDDASEEHEKPEIINLVESSTLDDEEPTDLSLKLSLDTISDNTCDVIEEPTDLSIPKVSTNRTLTPRPPSQNSEAIQSPQPSGIPAVPQSPDIVSTTATSSNKTKSVFLESLLSNSSKKIALNSEVTIIRQKEPLDLGKCRKSASPTVTCSEEINSRPSDLEPPAKKFKSVDITLKTLLDAEIQKPEVEVRAPEKNIVAETPRLLELLKNTESEPDPLTQLKQLLADPSTSVPDPMLVPKDKFSLILTRPGIEIPKLLKERPELRIPEALAFPHIMQDPNMLVLNIHHLESILSSKAAQSMDQNENNRANNERNPEKTARRNEKSSSEAARESPHKKRSIDNSNKSSSATDLAGKTFNELANDIDAATQAAFSQMVWLPYLNHLEAMSVGNNNADMMKMLTNSLQSFPFYPNQMNQMTDLSHLFGNSRFPSPVGFPLQPPINYSNPLELNMWQEAMLQANMLRNKSTFENLSAKHSFRDYLEKINVSQAAKKPAPTHNQRMHMPSKPPQSFPSNFYPPTSNGHAAYQNPYMNVNMPNPYQTSNPRPNLQIPHFNPMSHQKSAMNQQKQAAPSYLQKQLNHYQHQHQQKLDNNQNFGSIYSQLSEQEKHQYLQSLGMNSQEPAQYQHHQPVSNQRRESSAAQKPKLACKPFAAVTHSNHKSAAHHDHQKEKSSSDFCRQQPGHQPIDLSGSTTPGSKLKVKQHLIDPANTPKLLKHHDDVPEVGSTTASIEEMQDAHKHLWHPLFGNQKGYNSPWNWTTVTATGE